MGKRPCELEAGCPYQARRAVLASSGTGSQRVALQDPHVHHQHLSEFSHDKPAPKAKSVMQTGKGHKLTDGNRLGSGSAGAGGAAGAAATAACTTGTKRPRDAKKAAAAAALARAGGAAGGSGAAKAAGKQAAADGAAKPRAAKPRTSGASARAAPEVIDLT